MSAGIQAVDGQKKLLALDGGGILGIISLGYLIRLEHLLRDRLKRGPEFVLADYFDYIAGNSTGAIIAAGLALGLHAEYIRKFYFEHGAEMFDKDWIINQKTFNKYTGANLKTLLQKEFGINTTLRSTDDPAGKSKALKTLLMVVMRNATTDSPWPVSSNPKAKYNDPSRPDCNLDLPLWKLVRASTAAPTYFPPEVVQLGKKEFVFVDGGVTVYNNPAFQLFMMATVDRYGLRWPTGEDKMLLVSVGTGASPDANPLLKPADMNILYNATHIPSALMAAANAQQDFLCRAFGRCVFGDAIDREVGDMIDSVGPGPAGSKHFTYIRYNPDITQAGLDALGLQNFKSADVQAIDSVAHIQDLDWIGQVAAGRSVDLKHYEKFL